MDKPCTMAGTLTPPTFGCLTRGFAFAQGEGQHQQQTKTDNKEHQQSQPGFCQEKIAGSRDED